MKFFIALSILACSLSCASCSHKASSRELAARADSLRAANDRIYQSHLAELSKFREPLIGPAPGGEGKVDKGDQYRTYLLDPLKKATTLSYEKLNAKLEAAQKDSTTQYGALLTRFRLMKSQHKYLTATYSDDARLLRFSSEISFDDKHEEDRDFYFNGDTLIYFRERRTSSLEEEDLMTDDSYFIQNGIVVYAYRDEGTAQAIRDKMNVMSIKRYKLTGDLEGHVYKEFDSFKGDYEILQTEPLEPLIYPGPNINKQ